MPASESFSVTPSDLEEVAALIRVENNEPDFRADYLKWWYFDHPHDLFSFIAAKDQGKINAVAAIHGLKFRLGTKTEMLGMPQKVLTAKSAQGKGLFGALYRKTEEEMRAKGVSSFITFTNEMSTPIFLAKFGYVRGICPELHFVPATPLRCLAARRYDVLRELPASRFQSLSSDNAVEKDGEYFRWRYGAYRPGQYSVLQVIDVAGAIAGYSILKRVRKIKGLVPMYLLMDALLRSPADAGHVAEQSAVFAAKNLSAGISFLDHPALESWLKSNFHKTVRDRFNFLVKGDSPDSTEKLSKTRFNLTFGDLDFI